MDSTILVTSSIQLALAVTGALYRWALVWWHLR
jgi:hypothetical protein